MIELATIKSHMIGEYVHVYAQSTKNEVPISIQFQN